MDSIEEAAVCTIYVLKNKISGKIYVGQTWLTLGKRSGYDGCNYKNSTYLFSAIKKHGFANFEYAVLCTCSSQNDANIKEEFYINELESQNPEIGYNIKNGGSNGKHTEQTIEKIRLHSKKFWEGKELPKELKDKLSATMSGRKLTDEHREQVMKTLVPGGFIGHHHTDEAKAAMGAAAKKHVITEQETLNRSKAHMIGDDKEKNIIADYVAGINIKDIVKKYSTGNATIYRILKRNNIPKAGNFSKWTGKTHSEETKEKMSDAAFDVWKDRKDT